MRLALLTDLESRFGERNARILRNRETQRIAAYYLEWEVNNDWHTRMWQTPDIAVCLGRFG